MVAINNSAEAKTFKTARFAESIKSHKSGNDILTGKTVDLSAEVTIEPKSVLVLELN